MNQHKVYRAIRKKTQSRKAALVAAESWNFMAVCGFGALAVAVVTWLLTR